MKVNGYEIKAGANLIDADLEGANLRSANLIDADLEGADLRSADLRGADLRGADLRRANLRGADLRGANLEGADLEGANLEGANLRGVDLRGANLRGANLYGSNLYGANLYGADLCGADLRGAIGLSHCIIIPQEGSFIFYKKVRNSGKNYILTLRCPSKAQRVNCYSSRKIRVSQAKVIKIEDMSGNLITDETITFRGTHYFGVEYKLKSTVYPDSFNDDPRLECVSGIHGFITKQEAIEW